MIDAQPADHLADRLKAAPAVPLKPFVRAAAPTGGKYDNELRAARFQLKSARTRFYIFSFLVSSDLFAVALWLVGTTPIGIVPIGLGFYSVGWPVFILYAGLLPFAWFSLKRAERAMAELEGHGRYRQRIKQDEQAVADLADRPTAMTVELKDAPKADLLKLDGTPSPYAEDWRGWQRWAMISIATAFGCGLLGVLVPIIGRLFNISTRSDSPLAAVQAACYLLAMLVITPGIWTGARADKLKQADLDWQDQQRRAAGEPGRPVTLRETREHLQKVQLGGKVISAMLITLLVASVPVWLASRMLGNDPIWPVAAVIGGIIGLAGLIIFAALNFNARRTLKQQIEQLEQEQEQEQRR